MTGNVGALARIATQTQTSKRTMKPYLTWFFVLIAGEGARVPSHNKSDN